MLTPLEEETRRTLYRQGLSDRRIAEQVNVTPEAITAWRRTHGLPANFVFVVSVSGVAIVSPSINGYSDLDFILYDFVAETAGSFSGDFSGYPISDCYKSYEEAEAALQGEQEEKQ